MRTFEEFVQHNIVRKKKKDELLAQNILQGAQHRKNILEKYLPLNEETSVQIIEGCYDIIRELIEATLSKEGYKTYSHEAAVAYFAYLGFGKADVDFLDTLREVRNGTKYYGKLVMFDYAKRVKEFLERHYSRLLKIASE